MGYSLLISVHNTGILACNYIFGGVLFWGDLYTAFSLEDYLFSYQNIKNHELESYVDFNINRFVLFALGGERREETNNS